MRFTTLHLGIPVLALAALLLGCEGPIDAGGASAGAAQEDDPLAVPDDVDPASLDALHRTVILRSCAATPGLCHHGQFEPNLSTPALTYENLVLRPSLERRKQARVVPGDPAGSLLMDKLRNVDVISQMPLGADPLPDEEIAAIEAWIQAGALRRPGAEPAPVLNNPPRQPEIAIFDAAGVRLDGAGQVVVSPGAPLTFRMTVEDFETDDANIVIGAFQLLTSDNRTVVLVPGGGASDNVGIAEYDPAGPESKGDLLNYRFDFAFGDTVTLVAEGGQTAEVPSAGLTLTPLAFYADHALETGGMLTFSFTPELLKVEAP
jgi:hypothetical protein